MAQTWNAIPLLATTDTLSDSRGYINDAFAALRSSFSGSAAPGTPVEGQFFYDTDTNVLSIYDGAAWVTIGDVDSEYLGLLPLSAGASYALTSDLYCGSNKLINVADPTADQHAATRKYCTDTFVELGGDTMTGDLVMGANDVTSTQDPSVATALARKSYVDTQVLGGGTYTGDIAMGDTYEVTGLPTPSVDSAAARKSYVDGKFHVTTGHDHDGTDAKKVLVENLDASSFAAGNLLKVNAGATALEVSGGPKGDESCDETEHAITTSWTTAKTITFTTSCDNQKIIFLAKLKIYGYWESTSGTVNWRIRAASETIDSGSFSSSPVYGESPPEEAGSSFWYCGSITITTAASTAFTIEGQVSSGGTASYIDDIIFIVLEVGTP